MGSHPRKAGRHGVTKKVTEPSASATAILAVSSLLRPAPNAVVPKSLVSLVPAVNR